MTTPTIPSRRDSVKTHALPTRSTVPTLSRTPTTTATVAAATEVLSRQSNSVSQPRILNPTVYDQASSDEDLILAMDFANVVRSGDLESAKRIHACLLTKQSFEEAVQALIQAQKKSSEASAPTPASFSSSSKTSRTAHSSFSQTPLAMELVNLKRAVDSMKKAFQQAKLKEKQAGLDPLTAVTTELKQFEQSSRRMYENAVESKSSPLG